MFGKIVLAVLIVIVLPAFLYAFGATNPGVFTIVFAVIAIACIGLMFRPLPVPLLRARWSLASLVLAFSFAAIAVSTVMSDEDLAELRAEDPEAYLAYIQTRRGDDAWLAELETLDPDAFAAETERRAAEEAAETARREEAARARREARDAARAALAAESLADYVEQLETELASLQDFDATDWTSDYDRIVLGAGLFAIWGELYREGRDYELTAEQAELRQRFRRELIREQRESLPTMRDRFGPAARQRLWIADASARTIGNGFRTVEFVSGAFAANRNIQEFQVEMGDIFSLLRFKQSRYKWYEEADRYTYYDLITPDDDDIVYLAGGRAQTYRE
ncbi:hypothetical protein [Hyphobacterium marinum]|uniref:Uncharacterized protein n=1 Tax=Hyphobacterium marinum TaxID=3116574 RepID=A0ABU7LY91_9PROT|nr:hypothetical protein [Hyphobacterium sp. Y6023]MEE2566416.1 hypothetical protein [Hyphobacterium sp. Y6023]